MDGLQRMNEALEYMENHMDQPLPIEEIAKAAYLSPFHFQRMFHMLTGMTVAEYMRKRKLTLAANELATSSVKVVDVALKYGYDSPEAFAKAFRKLHGISPSEARQSGVHMKAFPRISFQVSLKGDKEFLYRIEDKEAFTVAGKSVQLNYENPKRSRSWFWGECSRDGTLAKLTAMRSTLLGITMDIKDDFAYMIACKADGSAPVDGLSLQEIPASTWAIFTSVGPLPQAIQSVFHRVYQEFFPATGYEHSGAPELEVYLPGDSKTEDYRCEVWIPVVKK
ncbi:AraC family transcriptional regulator [Paenibacillus thermotolerans]|uniref:AraC family transcriptional regulator n=1 Tax=Paenibacillus thermotolerans TaxID=3027807 RepID=UPI00236839F3|nr:MULTISPECIES: AraC family transcriptional regulator [unclassified Paenibacillus]